MSAARHAAFIDALPFHRFTKILALRDASACDRDGKSIGGICSRYQRGERYTSGPIREISALRSASHATFSRKDVKMSARYDATWDSMRARRDVITLHLWEM